MSTELNKKLLDAIECNGEIFPQYTANECERICLQAIKDAFDAGENYGRQDVQVETGRRSNVEFNALDKEEYIKQLNQLK